MTAATLQDQLDLEKEMRSATEARFYSLHDKAADRGDFADTFAGRNLFDYLFKPFRDGIQSWVDEKNAGGAGRRPRAVYMINEFADIDTMAYIYLKHAIDTIFTFGYTGRTKQIGGGAARKTRVVLSCSMAIHDELRMRYFKDNRRELLKKIVEDFQRRELPRRRRRELMIRQFHAQQLEWQAKGWGQSERLNLGIALLEILKSTTGVLEEIKEYSGVKTIDCLVFTQDFYEQLTTKMDNAANLFTVYYPTIIPPKEWSNDALIGGGYHSEDVQPYRFVKGAKTKYLAELENTDLSQVLKATNAMQNTAWRINPVMVNVLHHVYSHNLTVKGIPYADPEPIPEPSVNIENDDEAAAAYRKECYMIHDSNRRLISKRIAVLRTLALADRFATHSAIYFPYDVDSRGRAYPKVAFLNPQGPDYVKGVLEFAEGKPIENEEHAAYMAIAIANAWGQDKLPLQDRVDWVDDNSDMLMEVALDPYADLRWTKADEPFMALRGAMEWAGFVEYGYGYLSHMPVHFDATCSGLQHFSALLRDAEGGFYVNLTGAPDRQDIYAEVARKATESLSKDDSTEARVALEIGVTRSLCKRPVMIVPYAGTFTACMAYVNEYYKELAAAGEPLPLPLDEIRRDIAPKVAKHIWDAISNTVIAARGAMDWITDTARLVSKGSNAPIQWTTPDGFTVQQAKYKEQFYRVNTILDGGRRIRSNVVKETPELDARKMAQSLSPNYIHSLDACHMRMSINRGVDIGGMSFAMIHDSFGVHASDMPVFADKCIKPAFVEMYERGDNLEVFAKEIILTIIGDNSKEQVKPLPSKGVLEIEEVLQSQFFFS